MRLPSVMPGRNSPRDTHGRKGEGLLTFTDDPDLGLERSENCCMKTSAQCAVGTGWPGLMKAGVGSRAESSMWVSDTHRLHAQQHISGTELPSGRKKDMELLIGPFEVSDTHWAMLFQKRKVTVVTRYEPQHPHPFTHVTARVDGPRGPLTESGLVRLSVCLLPHACLSHVHLQCQRQ